MNLIRYLLRCLIAVLSMALWYSLGMLAGLINQASGLLYHTALE